MLVILVIMVSTKASLRETEWVGSEVRGLNEGVLEVFSNTSVSVTVSLASTSEKDRLLTIVGSLKTSQSS